MQEDNNQLKIGTLPAKYIKGEGFWTAFAVNNQGQVYNLHVKKFKDDIVAVFRIDGEEKFCLTGSSFHRVLKCAAAASNAYIQENVHTLERRRRRRAEAREDRKGDSAQ